MQEINWAMEINKSASVLPLYTTADEKTFKCASQRYNMYLSTSTLHYNKWGIRQKCEHSPEIRLQKDSHSQKFNLITV